MNLDELERLRVRIMEDLVVDSIPKDLLADVGRADREFAAKGGCPGCKSQRIGVHYLPCPRSDADPDLY